MVSGGGVNSGTPSAPRNVSEATMGVQGGTFENPFCIGDIRRPAPTAGYLCIYPNQPELINVGSGPGQRRPISEKLRRDPVVSDKERFGGWLIQRKIVVVELAIVARGQVAEFDPNGWHAVRVTYDQAVKRRRGHEP